MIQISQNTGKAAAGYHSQTGKYYCMAQKFYMEFNFMVLWLMAEP